MYAYASHHGSGRYASRRFVIVAALVAFAALGMASSAMARTERRIRRVQAVPDRDAGIERLRGVADGKRRNQDRQHRRADREHTDAAGRLRRIERGTAPRHFYGAKNGETFSKTAQKVPGGLLDFVKCNEIKNIIVRIACEVIFENRLTGVNAVTELAKPASSIYFNEACGARSAVPAVPAGADVAGQDQTGKPAVRQRMLHRLQQRTDHADLTTGATSRRPEQIDHGKLEPRKKAAILVISKPARQQRVRRGKAHGCGLLGLLDGLIESKSACPRPRGRTPRS